MIRGDSGFYLIYSVCILYQPEILSIFYVRITRIFVNIGGWATPLRQVNKNVSINGKLRYFANQFEIY